jgi:membrane associated rhomboid family serine protease
MIPIRDVNRSEHFPLINVAIIAVNVLAFIWQMAQGPQLKEALFLYGIVPSRYSDPMVSVEFTTLQQTLPFLTSMFLHGGIMHILGNMWFLYIFGDNIEDRLGHLRYLVFYLLCGIAAGFVHLVTNWHSQMPTIGASGAIAGVMGGYLLLYPRARILTLIPIIFFFQFVELPAYIFLGFWIFIQVISAGFTRSDVGGIAWFAHIGGFVVGLVMVKVFQWIPHTGMSETVRRQTERNTTPRLQTVRPQYAPEELDSYGSITITTKEAELGTRKVLSVSQGLKKRTIMATIPAGVKEGTSLRFQGLGKMDKEGNRGDLYLEVRIRS